MRRTWRYWAEQKRAKERREFRRIEAKSRRLWPGELFTAMAFVELRNGVPVVRVSEPFRWL